MKTLVKITTFVVLLITATSCFMDGIKGDRNVVSERRSISSEFDAIKVSQGIEVYLTLGNDVSLTLEADENLHDIIITEVKDGVLHLYADKNIWSAKSRKIYLTASEIRDVSVTSGAEIKSENTIKTDEFKIKVTSGGEVQLRLDVEDLSCNTTSGADAKLEGRASNFTAKSTSGSDIKAGELEVENCNASVTSGADIYVKVSGSLDANATSGGDIKYSGDPKNVQHNESSSGSIRKVS